MVEQNKKSPWVVRYETERDTQLVTDAHVPRAALILQRIVDEAVARGFAMVGIDDTVTRSADTRDWDWAHLVFRDEDAVYYLRINEICKPGAAQAGTAPHAETSAADTRPRWLRERARPFASSGMLQLTVKSRNAAYHQRSWRDCSACALESRIDEMLNTLVTGRARMLRDRQDRREWEQAMHKARERYWASRMLELVDRQAVQSEMRERQRRYLDVLEQAATSYGGDCEAALVQIIAQLRDHLGVADPADQLDVLFANVPNPTYHDLEPFLSGWSPYGPTRTDATKDADGRWRTAAADDAWSTPSKDSWSEWPHGAPAPYDERERAAPVDDVCF